MDHIAIMKKSWHLLDKILSGRKKIESRWYKAKYPPWNRINAGETVYFKNSGELVSIKAEVEKVLQFSDLHKDKIKKILEDYGEKIGILKEGAEKFAENQSRKKFCILVFLRNPQKIMPFEIDKTGFGLMSAWICVDDINRIKKQLR